MGSAISVAVLAAIAFGWSTALMHHGASGAPADVGGMAGLLRHVVVQWRWLIGMAASLIGLGLHTYALHLGTIALVQPLVVSGLVFSFIFRSALDRRFPSRHLLAWASVTAAGLALFVIAASSTKSSGALDGLAATLMLGIGAAVVLVTSLLAARAKPDLAGVLLGVSAGVVFGLIAGTLKATTDAAARGDLFTSWPFWLLFPLGAAGFLLNQRAYHQAPLSRSLPALNTVNPLVAVAFGMAVFHERPSAHAASIAAEAVGLIAVLSGIFFLAQTEEVTAAA